jgi:hypothetical protein
MQEVSSRMWLRPLFSQWRSSAYSFTYTYIHHTSFIHTGGQLENVTEAPVFSVTIICIFLYIHIHTSHFIHTYRRSARERDRGSCLLSDDHLCACICNRLCIPRRLGTWIVDCVCVSIHCVCVYSKNSVYLCICEVHIQTCIHTYIRCVCACICYRLCMPWRLGVFNHEVCVCMCACVHAVTCWLYPMDLCAGGIYVCVYIYIHIWHIHILI